MKPQPREIQPNMQLESTSFWDGEFINHKYKPVTQEKLLEIIREKRNTDQSNKLINLTK